MLRIEPLKPDQAPSAILELVDGPKDMRFAMTARTVARCRANGHDLNEMTQRNIEKVTRYRPTGKDDLKEMVENFKNHSFKEKPRDKDATAADENDEGPLKRDNAATDESRWGGRV